jgi:two-component sensor histidine kinase
MLSWVRRNPRVLPWLVLVIGLTATALVTAQLWRLAVTADQARGQRQAAQVGAAITDRINNQIALLRGASGLFASVGAPTVEQFAAYVAELDLDRHYPGVLGVGYSARLDAPSDAPAAEAASPVAEASTASAPEAGDERHAIILLEPRNRRNAAAMGYDMFSEPTRRAAMERARDTGQPAATGRVELVQEIDSEKQPGFLIYLPVYGEGPPPKSLAERRDRLRGFVYSPFRSGDFFGGVVRRGRSPEVDAVIFDGAPMSDHLLFDSRKTGETGALLATLPLEVAGREWTLRVEAPPSSELTRRTLVLATGLIGLLATLICAGLAGTEVRSRLSLERALDEGRRSERLRDALLQELNHRVKNTLATVQSIARQSLSGAGSAEAARAKLEGRLRALAGTHDALTATHWEGASLAEVVDNELQAFGRTDAGRIHAEGPPIALSPRATLSLGMALHELATNAGKYGALSVDGGAVAVDWRIVEKGGSERLVIVWRESGGPPVTAPARRGFGATVIQRGPAHELGAEVDLRFPATGVECEISLPLGGAGDAVRRGAVAA